MVSERRKRPWVKKGERRGRYGEWSGRGMQRVARLYHIWGWRAVGERGGASRCDCHVSSAALVREQRERGAGARVFLVIRKGVGVGRGQSHGGNLLIPHLVKKLLTNK